MNHLKAIAEKLEAYGLDAMLVTSEPGGSFTLLVSTARAWRWLAGTEPVHPPTPVISSLRKSR